MEQIVYICKNKNRIIRNLSSSGGIFSALALAILKKEGVVFAAVYDANLKVCHQEIRKRNDLRKAYGAKYACSDLSGIFQRVKEILSAGTKVLFCGTPCQIASLKRFLPDDTAGLICIDFICHGVPTQKNWDLYLKSMRGKGIDIKEVNMRNKFSGWSKYQYCWKIKTRNGKTLYQLQKDNIYMKGFLRNYLLQPSCYSCSYKGLDRHGDITLGDCWGIWDFLPDFDDNRGTSLVLVNTAAGKELFDLISSKIISKPLEGNDYIRYNTSIIQAAKKPENYDQFHDRLNSGEDFLTTLKDCLGWKSNPRFKTFFEFVPTAYRLRNKIAKEKTQKP